MIIEDDALGPPRRPSAPVHEVGQTLDDLSIEEIAVRIEALRREIERLEAARRSKEATRAGAESLFKV